MSNVTRIDPVESRWARAAPLVAGALLALPTALAYYPPMTDLPSHEAVVGILRHWGDAAYFPRDLYVLNLGHSNQLFHGIAWFFSLAFGTRWAVKLTIILAQLAILHAGARFTDHIGRSRWSALLLAPLALGFTYYWGFVANLLGYAGLLYALPVFDRAAQSPSARRAGFACVVLVLLFLAHGSVFVMALPVVFVLALLPPLTLKARLLALAPVGFGVLVAGGGWWRASSLFTAGAPTYKTHFFPLGMRFDTLAEAFVGLDDPLPQGVLLGLAAVAAAALFVWRREVSAREPRPQATVADLPRWRALLFAYRFELLAVTLLAGYLAAPYHFQGAMFIHQRFLGPAWALLVLCAGPVVAEGANIASGRGMLARSTCLLFAIAVVVSAVPQFVDADRAHRDLDATMEHMPMQAAATFVSIDRGGASRGRAFDPSSGVARTVAQRGGRAGPSFTGSPICAVQIRREHRWDDYTLRIMTSGSRALAPTHDLDRFGWVVVRTRSSEIADTLGKVFPPDAELVFAQGEWLLFRSTHVLAELTSSEPPAPPRAEIIMDRVLKRQ